MLYINKSYAKNNVKFKSQNKDVNYYTINRHPVSMLGSLGFNASLIGTYHILNNSSVNLKDINKENLGLLGRLNSDIQNLKSKNPTKYWLVMALGLVILSVGNYLLNSKIFITKNKNETKKETIEKQVNKETTKLNKFALPIVAVATACLFGSTGRTPKYTEGNTLKNLAKSIFGATIGTVSLIGFNKWSNYLNLKKYKNASSII